MHIDLFRRGTQTTAMPCMFVSVAFKVNYLNVVHFCNLLLICIWWSVVVDSHLPLLVSAQITLLALGTCVLLIKYGTLYYVQAGIS